MKNTIYAMIMGGFIGLTVAVILSPKINIKYLFISIPLAIVFGFLNWKTKK